MLQTLFAELGLSQDSRLLDAGIGGHRWRNISQKLVKLSNLPVDHLELNDGRAETAKRQLGDKINLYKDQIDRFFAGRTYSFAYVDILPRHLPALFSSIIPAAASLSEPGGAIALNIPVKANLPADDAGVDAKAFSKTTQALENPGDFEKRLIECISSSTDISLVRQFESLNDPLNNWKYKTFVIRVDKNWPTVRFAEDLLDAQHFRLDDVANFLERLNGEVNFVPAGEFLQSRARQEETRDGRGIHFIKHDIHKDLLGAYRMAEIEAGLGIRAAYFVMHEHELSAHYHDRPETIEVLSAIQAMGHDIGVHVDALELALSPTGLIAGLGTFVNRLREGGIEVKYGNTHGNTNYIDLGPSGDMVFLEALEFYREIEWPTKEAEALAGSVSLKEISSRLGIDGWFDSELYYLGARIPTTKLLLSDNYHYLSLYDLPSCKNIDYDPIVEGEVWQFEAATVIDHIARASCLYLFHPQFYR